MTLKVLPLAGTLLLGACAQSGPTVGPSPYPLRSSAEKFVCRTTMLQQFNGQAASQELAVRMIQSSGAKTLQWIPVGTMVTMDFREDRLRVKLDAAGKVASSSCG
jgi:hypothetical protein